MELTEMKILKNTPKMVDFLIEIPYHPTNMIEVVFHADSTESKENINSLKNNGRI